MLVVKEGSRGGTPLTLVFVCVCVKRRGVSSARRARGVERRRGWATTGITGMMIPRGGARRRGGGGLSSCVYYETYYLVATSTIIASRRSFCSLRRRRRRAGM